MGVDSLRHLAARAIAGVLQLNNVLNLSQCETERLRLADESKPLDISVREHSVSGCCAFSGRNETPRLPISNRFRTYIRLHCSFTNSHQGHCESSHVLSRLTFPLGERSTIPGMIIHRLVQVARSYSAVARSPSYFPLWLSQLVSNFGDTLHYIALVVLVFEITGRGVAVAALAVAEIVPVLLLGPVAGVVIDRFNRKAILIGADLFRGTLALSLVWPQGVEHAYVVAAGIAISNTLFNATAQAVIPALTTEDERLAANSVSFSTGRLVQIIASAVAGGLIAVSGTSAAFGINAVTFFISAMLLARLRIPARAGQVVDEAKRGLRRFVEEARAGLRYALRDRFISRLLIVQSVASFAVGATGPLLVVLSERHLRLPPSGFAWLIGAIGVGALLGPLIPNTLAIDYRNARWLFVPYIVRGIGDMLIAVFTPLPVALVIMFVYGLNTSTGNVVFSTTVQGAVPDSVRGRVFTLLDVDWSALRLVSLALGAVMVDAVGIQPVFWMGGTLLVLAGVLGLLLLGDHDFRSPAVVVT